MKKLILLATLLTYFTCSSAQDFIDNSLLFSRTQPNGSARIQGIGGAQVALGGDYSSALSNPAGLGMFNRNEYTISAGLNFLSSKSTWFGEQSSDSKTNFNMPGFSMVFHSPAKKEGGFVGGTFGISMTRTNDLNQVYNYSGNVDNLSIIDYFIQDAGTINPSDMLIDQNGNMGWYYKSLTGLAYNNYLIDEMTDDNGDVTGYNSVLNFSTSRQHETSVRTGAQYQWSFAYGANFSDKVFVGANVGVATIKYKLIQRYGEDNFVFPPNYNPANSFDLEEQFDVSGTGFNGTLGVIYRPVDHIQVGASYTTPTSYSLRDKYFASMGADWNGDPDTSEDFRDPDILEYRLKTPGKAHVGATYISKLGFITADVEYVDYSNSNYKDRNDSFDFEGSNSDINNELKSVMNISVGGELRFADAFRYRLGWNLMPDPYTENSGDPNPVDRKVSSYSTGFGYRKSNFYVDLTGIYSTTEGKRIPYFVEGRPDPTATQSFNNVRLVMTLGFTF